MRACTVQMRLDPLASKAAVCTGNIECLCTVLECQPRALEVVIADQRFPLSHGDHFRVPPHTVYGVTNSSAHAAASVAFVQIAFLPPPVATDRQCVTAEESDART